MLTMAELCGVGLLTAVLRVGREYWTFYISGINLVAFREVPLYINSRCVGIYVRSL